MRVAVTKIDLNEISKNNQAGIISTIQLGEVIQMRTSPTRQSYVHFGESLRSTHLKT